MQRRQFITLIGSVAAWPLAARAQQPDGMRHIGVLTQYAEEELEFKTRDAAFREGLAKLGWIIGRNLRADYRFGSDTLELARHASAQLIRLAPDVILANNSLNTQALAEQTRSIPIVFVGASDPAGSGIVTSLAHPGGNVTGFSNYEFSIGGKWLDILKEMSPGLRRVLFIQNPGNVGNEGLLQAAESSASKLGVTVLPVPLHDVAAVEGVIREFAREPDGGLIAPPGGISLKALDQLVVLTARYRIPAIHPDRQFVRAGGLMSYGIDSNEMLRQAASYVDRILRGENAGELPVQTPIKFDFVVNLNTAKALGITIPLPLIGRADEVIE